MSHCSPASPSWTGKTKQPDVCRGVFNTNLTYMNLKTEAWQNTQQEVDWDISSRVSEAGRLLYLHEQTLVLQTGPIEKLEKEPAANYAPAATRSRVSSLTQCRNLATPQPVCYTPRLNWAGTHRSWPPCPDIQRSAGWARPRRLQYHSVASF